MSPIDDTSPSAWVATLLGLLLATFLLGLYGGTISATAEWQRNAVSHGAAEWYLDEHHERQWRWKP